MDDVYACGILSSYAHHGCRGREKRAEKRARTGRARPLSREEADSAALAIEETVKELISMGFDEQAAREAVHKARQDIQVSANPVTEKVPTSAPQASRAGRKRKSSAGPATPGALGAAVAPASPAATSLGAAFSAAT